MEEIDEVNGEPIYYCDNCDKKMGASTLAEAKSVREAETSRMRRRERRAEGW